MTTIILPTWLIVILCIIGAYLAIRLFIGLVCLIIGLGCAFIAWCEMFADQFRGPRYRK